jgi:glutamate-ammonia-ligase adenylyltransferase
MTSVEPFYMNAEQLHKTLVASQYAEQVLNLYKTELEQE